MQANYRYEVKYWDMHGAKLCVEVVIAPPDDWRIAERMVAKQAHVTSIDGSVFVAMTACEPGIKEDTIAVLSEPDLN